MPDVNALRAMFDGNNEHAQTPSSPIQRPMKRNFNTLPPSFKVPEVDLEAHISRLMGFGHQGRARANSHEAPPRDSPMSGQVSNSAEWSSGETSGAPSSAGKDSRESPSEYARTRYFSAKEKSPTAEAHTEADRRAWPLAPLDQVLRVVNCSPSISERSSDGRPSSTYNCYDVATAETVEFYRGSSEYVTLHQTTQPQPSPVQQDEEPEQLCECEVPNHIIPPTPSHHAATETLASNYPHIFGTAPRFGTTEPPKPTPRRLPHNYRASTAFSFERPPSSTPFSSRSAIFVPPNDLTYPTHHAISGTDLELNSVIATMEQPIRRTLWHEERRAVSEDVSALVLGSTKDRVQIRYADEPKKREKKEEPAPALAPMIEEPKKKGKFKWSRVNLFKRKKALDNFSLLDAADMMSGGRTGMISDSTSRAQHSTTHDVPLTPPRLLPRPSFPAPRRDSPMTRFPRISTLGCSRHNAPATSSPLRQEQRHWSAARAPTPAPKKKRSKLTKKPVVGGGEKRPWWRIGRRAKVVVDVNGGNGKGRGGKTVVTPAQQAGVRERTRTVM
jgi:hypothetical protein